MKRILLIAGSNMSLSGVPVVYMSIVRGLYKKCIFDIVLLKNNDMYFEKEFLSYGGKIYFFNCQKPNRRFKKILWYLGSFNKKARKFIENEIDLSQYCAIHSFSENLAYPFLKEAKKNNIKKRIIHFNSPDSAYPLQKHIKNYFLKKHQIRSLKLCTDLVFVSQAGLKYSNYKNKGIVIYNTYDENKYSEIIENTSNKLSLCQVSTIANRKNQLFSLRVIKLLRQKYPDISLSIVGKEVEDGYLDKVKAYVQENALENNVFFFDSDYDQRKLFEQTSYSILPSTLESFGLVLIEAQICGLHCFASNVIPTDTDMGNIDYLELDEKKWADEISSYFEKNKNKRKEPLNKTRFSKNIFIKKIEKLYN